MNEDQRKAFEEWAKSEGLDLRTTLPMKPMTLSGRRFPASYREDETECAWRAWANKPEAALAQREPVHVEGNDMSAERVDKSDKNRHEPVVRFCYECDSVGEVGQGFIDCCPDGNHAAYIPQRVIDYIQRTEAGRLAAEHYANLLHESHKIGASQLEGYEKQVIVLQSVVASLERECAKRNEQIESMRTDNARLKNDLVAALAECKVKQETILGLLSHDDKRWNQHES